MRDIIDEAPEVNSLTQGGPGILTQNRFEMPAIEPYRFVRTCVSCQPQWRRREEIMAFCEGGVEWDLIVAEAARHGVLPLFLENLKVLVGDRLPTSMRDRVRNYHQKLKIHAAFLVKELNRVLCAFEEKEIPVLVLKGPVLARTAYGELHLRRYVDLDVLVPRERFPDADRVLQTAGYEYPRSKKEIAGWRKRLLLFLSGQWQYTRASGAFNLDVHTRVMPPGFALSSDFEPFWDRSTSVELGNGISVPGFAAEDMALILAYHGVKNEWRTLKYVADLAQLIRSGSEMDWYSLLARAQEMHSSRVLKSGLVLANDVLCVSLPPEVEAWIERSELGSAVPLAKRHMRDKSLGSTLSFRDRVRFQLDLKDNFADRISYGAYSALRHIWSTFLKP